MIKIFGKPPEFFDIFGLIAFSIIFFIGIFMFLNQGVLPIWISYFLIFLGFLGIFVDGLIVRKIFINWLKNKNV